MNKTHPYHVILLFTLTTLLAACTFPMTTSITPISVGQTTITPDEAADISTPEIETTHMSFRPYLIGWYSRIEHTNKLAEFANNGVGLVLPYSGAGEVNKVQRYLDEAQRVGIRVMLDRHTHPSLWEPPDMAELRQDVQAHKSHSALYGWYIADEPELLEDSEPPDYFEPIYNTIKIEDPNHPIALIHANNPQDEYVNVYDVLMIDYYPGWKTTLDPDEFNWWVRHSYTRWQTGIAFAEQHNKDAFIAVGLGFGNNDDGTDNQGVRDLTIGEYRFHTFSAVVLGADGFLYWKEESANAIVRKRVNQVIGEVQAMGAEMNNGTTNDSRITVNASPEQLVYRYGINDSRHVILAVNIANHAAPNNNQGAALTNIQFTLPDDIDVSQVEVLHEGRIIPVENGTFTDSFERFEVHAYAFSTATMYYMPLLKQSYIRPQN